MAGRIVEVVEFDPQWAIAFDRARRALLERIGEGRWTIEHIGSTAVPGLAAKPVIDLLVEVEDLALLDEQRTRLEVGGWTWRGENGIPGRRYLHKGAPQRTHHLHAFATGDATATRHRAFRDYLIDQAEVAAAYAALKRRAAAACRDDPAAYAAAKSDFIAEHLPRAMDRWHASA